MAMSNSKLFGIRGYGAKISVSRENGGITIFLYDDFHLDNTPNYFFEITDYDKSYDAEHLCHKAANHLGIGTITFPLFAMFDLRRNVWLAPNSRVHCSREESRLLVFRMRFMPSPRAIVNIIFVDDQNSAKYLFLQCRHDFINELLVYKKDKTSNEHILGLVVMDLVRYGKEKQLDLKQIENLDIKHFIPSSLIERYKYVWDKKRLHSNIKPFLHKQYEKEKQCKALKLMKGFILGLRGYMENYGAETFDIGTGHKVCVDPHRPDGKAAIFNIINDKEEIDFCQIEELISLSTHPKADNMVSVMLNRRDNRPEQIDFTSKEVAVSFIALLDGYHRMLEDYHHNLCPIVVNSPELGELQKFGCHGPVTKKWAEDRLRQWNSTDVAFNYLLKLRSSTHSALVLAYINMDKRVDFYIIKTFHEVGEVRYGIDISGEPHFLSVPELLKSYKSNSHHKLKLKKCVRPIDPLDKRLYLCREETMQNVNPVKRSKQHKAEVCLVSGVHLEDSLGVGQFTEVYKGKWEKENSIQTVAIKRLRKEDSHGRFMKLEEFTKSIHKAAFWFHATITTVHALCLAPNFCMLMEYAELGPLDKYLKLKKSELEIYSLIMVAEQLAQALLYLETRQSSSFSDEKGDCHGNIRARNIVVFEQKDKHLRIKLSDPGMIYAYNKLEITAPENADRLPWIAPELYNNLSRMTLYSDRYAYGMTLWEILSQGDRPFTYMDFDDIMKFVQHDRNTLDKPHPDCPLKMYTLMKRCWSLNPQDRITAKEIVRDICNFLQSDYLTQDYETPHWKPEASSSQWLGTNANNGSDLASHNWLAEDIHGPGDHVTHDGPYGATASPTLSNGPLNSSGETRSNFSTSGVLPQSESMLSCNSTTPLVLDHTNFAGTFGSTGSGLSQITTSTQVQEYDCQEQARSPEGAEQPHSAEGRFRLRRPLPETPEMPQPVEPLHHESLKCDFHFTLGEGHYGTVYKGFFITNHGNPRPVAIKTLKPKMYREYADEFEKEFNIMIKLNHHRIVEIIGHCPQKDPQRPMWLVMEFVDNGSLIKYLHKNKSNLRIHKMIQFGCEIAEGMEYLSMKKILHRDLAARNVLVTKDDHMKITDFGLARVVQGDKNYYTLTSGKEFPMFWTAPEALLYNKYTVQSDVWSYGVTLWEIFSYGDGPKYDNLVNVNRLATLLNDGERLSKSKTCPDDIHRDVIMKCWYFEPTERNNFTELRLILEDFLKLYAGRHE